MEAGFVEQNDTEIESAFVTLVAVVQERSREGKSTRSAGLKPALQTRTNHSFDEHALGFSTFRAFLSEAARRALIVLSPVEGVPDVDVAVPDQLDAPSRSAGHDNARARSGRMRPDLWNAFVRWHDGTDRYWDRESDQVIRTPAGVPPPSHGDRYIRITPIEPETVGRWMREMVDGQLDPRGAATLSAALQREDGVVAFVAEAKRLGVIHEWHRFQARKVFSLVEQWRHDNALADSLSVSETKPTSRPKEASSYAPGGEDELRTILHRWIDEMTYPELLAISVPVRLVRR